MTSPNDGPLAELASVRDEIDRTETEVLPRLRSRRDELICDARRRGAIGDVLADASGLSRQSVHIVLRTHGIPPPNRGDAAHELRRRRWVRADLARALSAAGIDTDNITAEAVRTALADDTEQTGD